MCDDLSLSVILDKINEDSLVENSPVLYNSEELYTSPDNKDVLGCGSYALVRRVYHKNLKFAVVKYFLLNGSKKLINQKFQNAIKEAKVLGSIKHPNIVQVFGMTSWKNCCGIIMEEVSGGTLEDLLLQNQTVCISWNHRSKFFYEIANALNYLHYHNPQKSFIHGDLKPQNILLTQHLTLKLADFGSVAIVHATGMVSSSLNPTSKQYTPLYSAPEFLKDFKQKTCAIDIYSFAMVGYEIITQQRVFCNASVALPVLLSLISETDLKPDTKCFDDVEKCFGQNSSDFIIFENLKDVVVKCWNSDPEKRPKSSDLFELLTSMLSPNEFGTNSNLQSSIPSIFDFDKTKLITLNQCVGPSEFSLIKCNKSMLSSNLNEISSVQKILDYLSAYLSVSYKVITNRKYFSPQEVTLLNKGNLNIPNGNSFNWALYFNDFHLLEHRHLKTCNKFLLSSSCFELIHVDGTLYMLKPTAQFKGLKPQEAVVVKFNSHETISKNYIFPRWYVCSPGRMPQILQSTNDDQVSFVTNFTTAEQWKRSTADQSNPFSASERFHQYHISDTGSAPLRIIPSPLIVELENAHFVSIHSKQWHVCSESICFEKELSLVRDTFGINILSKEYISSSNVIVFKQGSVDGVKDSKDAYKIEINSHQSYICITANSHSGAFYAVQSLISLAESQNQNQCYKLPAGVIKDAPRFDYRGLVVDVARNFIEVKDIQLIIETMASYKLNKLVLHLADNEGWRIEIEDLPELTEIGAVRCHSDNEENGVFPAFGSGPFDNTSGSGYYSISDYKSILKVAAANCIDIIPNIGMPGNLHAAIVSMSARYKRLLQENKPNEAKEFLLSDPDKPSLSTGTCLYNYKNSYANPCLDSTYKFVDCVVASLKKMHEDIQPLQVVLLGGDGIMLSSDLWSDSKCFKDFKARHLCNNVKTGQELFTRKVSEICLNHGIKMGVYGNGALKESLKEPCEKYIFNDHDVLVYAVNPRWIEPFSNVVHSFANADYQVVVGHCATLFLDHPQEPDPNEAGMSWAARYIDDKAVFSFMPENLLKNHDSDTYRSTPLSGSERRKKEFVELTKRENIAGMQASLWTELLRNSQSVHHQLFPRLLAVSERAWHKAEWEESSSNEILQELLSKDWEEYANAVGYRELPRLKNKGILYRIPPPGVTSKHHQLQLTSLYPGLKYHFRQASDSSTLPWVECKINSVMPDIDATYEFVTVDGSRRSRVVTVDADELNVFEENARFADRMRQFDAHMTY